MIDKICNYLTNRIRKEMPEVDDQRAEIINYGLQNIIGEIPKIFLVFLIAYILNILDLTLIAFLSIFTYRTFSGGVHAKTHWLCIVLTNGLYIGTALLGKYIIIQPSWLKYIIIAVVWVFSMAMIKLYAPADTENVPILRKKDRRNKQILSYVTMTITLLVAVFIPIPVVANIIIIGVFLQTLSITRLVYKLTNNQYGHEIYEKQNVVIN